MDNNRFDHPSMSDVYKALDDYATAQELVKEALEDLQEAILDLPYKIGRNDELRIAAISYLFWNEEVVRQTWLAKAFNSTPHHIREMAARPSIIICRECKQPFEALIKRRDGEPSWDDSICQVCKEAQKQKWANQSQTRQIEQSAWEVRVQELRTMPYKDYLQTPEWQERRARAMKRAGFRCQVCNAYGVRLNTHHRTYERRGNEKDSDLIVLCENCHGIFHEKGSLASEN